MQTTLRHRVEFEGTGLHSGQAVRLRLCPAPAHHGIVFHRMDLTGPARILPALWDRIAQSPLNTRLESPAGSHVSTIEHLMAALAGTGVHNLRVEIDGPEVPILDGSAAPFVRAILRAGIRRLAAPLTVIAVRRSVEVRQGEAMARLDPAEGLSIDFTIDFADAAIGRQHRRLDLANGAFIRELCDSRTFCRQADVAAMQAQGLGLGGNYDNAVVVEDDRVLSPGGLRHRDEAVRHKMLDALGDLYTAGAPILGAYTGVRAGHGLTNRLLRALFATPGAWARVPSTPAIAARLPGSGIGPDDLAAVA